jgi:hypothetical protein
MAGYRILVFRVVVGQPGVSVRKGGGYQLQHSGRGTAAFLLQDWPKSS